jgi:hypothetical protein
MSPVESELANNAFVLIVPDEIELAVTESTLAEPDVRETKDPLKELITPVEIVSAVRNSVIENSLVIELVNISALLIVPVESVLI